MRITRARQPIRTLVLSLICLLSCTACGAGSNQKNTITRIPVGQIDCGIIMTQLSGQITDPTALKSENCFAAAFANCAPATLTFTAESVAAGRIHTMKISSIAGKCVITDVMQQYLAPHPTVNAGTITCIQLTQQKPGIWITGCSDSSSFLIPIPTT